jgi:hypothetical protein
MIIVAEIRVVLKMCVLSYICSSSSSCDDDFDDTKWCFVETCVALYFPSFYKLQFIPTVLCVTFFSTSKET